MTDLRKRLEEWADGPSDYNTGAESMLDLLWPVIEAAAAYRTAWKNQDERAGIAASNQFVDALAKLEQELDK